MPLYDLFWIASPVRFVFPVKGRSARHDVIARPRAVAIQLNYRLIHLR